VTLTWTTPRETTDHRQIKHLDQTRICRAVDVMAPVKCVETVSVLPAAQTPLAGSLSFTDVLPKQLQETHASGFADYAVEVENTYGRSAGLSNHVTVPLAPTLPPPSKLSAQVTADGVLISALGEQGPIPTGLTYEYRLYRRNQGARQQTDLGPITFSAEYGRPVFLDRTAEWEKTYLYKIASVTTAHLQGREESIEGEDSPEIEVFVHDIFPPAVPIGLQAVSAGTAQQPFIDLSWTPNTESDLAGYNVYRHEEGEREVKINRETVKVPAFRDTAVALGHRYFYSITAVDARGNESGKSSETSELVAQ
jgi:hypothetical protein